MHKGLTMTFNAYWNYMMLFFEAASCFPLLFLRGAALSYCRCTYKWRREVDWVCRCFSSWLTSWKRNLSFRCGWTFSFRLLGLYRFNATCCDGLCDPVSSYCYMVEVSAILCETIYYNSKGKKSELHINTIFHRVCLRVVDPYFCIDNI